MMKNGTAAGPTGTVSEMFTAEEDCSVKWLISLCNLILAQGRIPDDWRSSVLLPVFKGKGDPMECGSYRAIKLLEHAMKVYAIFTVWQMQEKYGCKGKKLYFAVVDLEKAFYRVPREVTRLALRKAEVEEWLVKAVLAMYEGH